MELVTLEVLFMIFFGAIVTDFITGVLVAAKQGKLKSRTCSNGMFRSIGECIVLVIFMLMDRLVPGLSLILSTFILGFVFKEGLSVVENLVQLDVWIPDSIRQTLEVGVNKVNSKEVEQNERY
jgi:toxin secretion/phage lysis holin